MGKSKCLHFVKLAKTLMFFGKRNKKPAKKYDFYSNFS